MPVRFDPRLWAFLARFMAQATARVWDTTMAALTPIDLEALAAFDELELGGVDAWTREGPFVIAFEKDSQAAGFLRELDGAVRHGQVTPLTPLAPMLSDAVTCAYRLDGQRFIEPGPYVEALGRAVVERGGRLRTDAEVVSVVGGADPAVILDSGERLPTDTVVIATGAWLPRLAQAHGVRTLVQAGRGYSFTVETTHPAEHPVYLPHHRIACTPYQGRFRIAGTMEFRGHGMWGIVLGPATGKFLAQFIDTGQTHPAIRPFDPLR